MAAQHLIKCSQAVVRRTGSKDEEESGLTKLRPAGRTGPPTSLIQPVNYPEHFSSATFPTVDSNSIIRFLSRKSHCIRPSSGRAVANSAIVSKRLATPGLHELDRQPQPSRGGCHICEVQDQRFTFCRRFGTASIFSTGSSACTRSVLRCV